MYPPDRLALERRDRQPFSLEDRGEFTHPAGRLSMFMGWSLINSKLMALHIASREEGSSTGVEGGDGAL